MKKLFWHSYFAFSFLFVTPFLHADLNSSTGRIASNIGTQQALNATTTCDLPSMIASSGGNLATPNIILCIMKAQNLTAPTSAAGVTTTIDVGGGQSLNVHYILSAPGPTIDGTSYAYEIKIWTCGSGCVGVGNYLPAIYAIFNADSSGSTNNGILINHLSADSGTIEGSSFIRWDTGSGTTIKNITMNMVDCHASPTGSLYAVYTRTGTVARINELYYNGTTLNRSAVAWDTSTDSGNWESDNTSNAGGDSPAWGGGFIRTATVTDFTYATHAVDAAMTINAYPTAIDGPTVISNQALPCSATDGVPTVANGSNVLTTTMTAMGGMTTHPPNL